MNPLTLLNPGRWLMLLAAAAALTLGYFAWADHQQNIGEKRVQLQWDASVSQQRAIALAETTANARESLRRIERQQEIDHAHQIQLAAARADAAATADAAARLRQRIAQLAAAGGQPSSHPAPSAVSPPAERVGDVAEQCVAAYSELAEAARRGLLAGNECAGRYDALKSNSRGAE